MSESERYRSYHAPRYQDFPDLELYMDQVISVLNKLLLPVSEEKAVLTSTMINNYVKQEILPPPKNKRYDRRHLALLFMICHLKRIMQLSDVSALLGRMVEESGVEGAYEAFRAEIVPAMEKTVKNTYKKETAAVLRQSAQAFAQLCAARRAFLDLNSQEAPEEKKEKKKAKDSEK